jgi:hypothetical protein
MAGVAFRGAAEAAQEVLSGRARLEAAQVRSGGHRSLSIGEPTTAVSFVGCRFYYLGAGGHEYSRTVNA